MDKLEKYNNRGYSIVETEMIYYSPDMDKTVKWFEDILGWYGNVFDRNEDNIGTYGFVSDLPQEIMYSGAVPARTIHIWHGDALERVIAFIKVRNVEKLRDFVIKHDWDKISDIYESGASPKTCDVTTIDGSVLWFFE